MYFDTEKKSQEEKALQALKQTKTVAQYTHTFSVHAHDTGWEPRTLVSQYTQGLKKRICLSLVLAQTKFDTLAAVTQLALKVNNKINGTDAVQGTAAPTPTPDPNAMDVSAFHSRMSDRKRKHMLRARLCFCCQAQGHLSCNFPQKGKPATTCISKLEAELKQLKGGTGKEEKGGRAEDSKNGGAQA
jgi:hypothetical protein